VLKADAAHTTPTSSRRGLTGWHAAAAASDPTLAFHFHGARNALCRAYPAVRRFARDPRWGRIDVNPEAAPHVALVHGYAKFLKLHPISKIDTRPKCLIFLDIRRIHAPTPREC
jgi:hypothetical protein